MSPTEVWEAVLTAARDRFRVTTVALWFEPIQPLGVEENRLVCSSPANLHGYLARRYVSWLADRVREVSELDGLVLREAK